MTHRLFTVGFCPSCGTGPLGVRICGKCGRPHVLCEECDAMWLTRDTTQTCIFPRQPEVPCAGCGHSLRDASAHWATWQELVRLTWESHVAGGASSPASNSSQESSTPSSLRPSSVSPPRSAVDATDGDDHVPEGGC